MVELGKDRAGGQYGHGFEFLDVAHQRKLQEKRFSLFIWVALASTFGYVIYSYAIDLAPSVFVTWSTFAGFCGSALAHFRFKNYRLASHLYLWSAAWAITTASLYTGQQFSESLWLLPIVPASGAYLLGTRAAITSSILCVFCVVGIHVSAFYVTLPEILPDRNIEFLIFRIMSLGMFTAFGVWTTTTTNTQMEALKAKAQELAIERERAQVANEAKSSFLANMSHEIRTPLNGMLGMTRHLHETAKSAAEKDKLETVLVSQESLLALLNDILDFSKIEAGEFALEFGAFDLKQTVVDVVRLFGPQAAGKGIEIEAVDSGGPSLVLGDAKRIRQVLCNLVGNAVKFSERGTITIEWETRCDPAREAGDCGVMLVHVKDEGMGIEPRMQERLFRKFEQVHDTTTMDAGGTGLGLAICKELVEAMQGTLSVQSEVGKGSVFTFEIPTQFVDECEQTASSAVVIPLPSQDEGSERSAQVLLVDDNAINRKVASLALEQLGCQVLQAADGQEALEICKTQPFDLIFMDLRMPRLNGTDATRAIREDARGPNQRTPIVALTANAYQEDRIECEKAGMQEHLSKPFRREDLQTVLDKYVWSSVEQADHAA